VLLEVVGPISLVGYIQAGLFDTNVYITFTESHSVVNRNM